MLILGLVIYSLFLFFWLSTSLLPFDRCLESWEPLCTTTQALKRKTEHIWSEPQFIILVGLCGYLCLFLFGLCLEKTGRFPGPFLVRSFCLVKPIIDKMRLVYGVFWDTGMGVSVVISGSRLRRWEYFDITSWVCGNGHSSISVHSSTLEVEVTDPYSRILTHHPWWPLGP